MHPAIFLDRDGVIIENCASYVLSWEDVHIFPQALAALARLKDSPYKIIIVTNQSAIGRGLLSRPRAEEINRRLLAEIEAAGGRVDGLYLCPHVPGDDCACRKPRPGLLRQAIQELELDPAESILIGDALGDLQAGRAAGVARLALVRTGLGHEQSGALQAAGFGAIPVFDTLAGALEKLAGCAAGE